MHDSNSRCRKISACFSAAGLPDYGCWPAPGGGQDLQSDKGWGRRGSLGARHGNADSGSKGRVVACLLANWHANASLFAWLSGVRWHVSWFVCELDPVFPCFGVCVCVLLFFCSASLLVCFFCLGLFGFVWLLSAGHRLLPIHHLIIYVVCRLLRTCAMAGVGSHRGRFKLL